jgi:hypothetical protein
MSALSRRKEAPHDALSAHCLAKKPVKNLICKGKGTIIFLKLSCLFCPTFLYVSTGPHDVVDKKKVMKLFHAART